MRGVLTTAMNSISGFAAADYCGGIPSPQDEKKDPNKIESDDVTYDDTSRPSGVSARSVCMGEASTAHLHDRLRVVTAVGGTRNMQMSVRCYNDAFMPQISIVPPSISRNTITPCACVTYFMPL